MKASVLVGVFAATLAGAWLASAATKPANDVSIRMKLADAGTAGPLAALTLKNAGTVSQSGIVVKVFAESETGFEMWSGTVDLLPGKSVKLSQRVWLDQDTTTLVATAALSGAADERPTDNAARAALGLKGKAGLVLVGRSIHLARCSSCHGDAGEGGSGPSLVGATSKTIAATMAGGGDHDFPWLSKTDAKNLGFFFRNPSGALLPPALPTPPAGGWPTYSGAVKALLDDRCIKCHGSGQMSAGIRLDTYSGASTGAKRALFAVKIGSMPQGGKRFSPTEIGLLDDWITGGRRP